MTTNRNWMVGFLVVAIVAGYFASIALITFAEVTDARLAQIIGLVTAVQNAFMLIIGYYFGSSSGSTRKTDMLNDLTGTGDGNGATAVSKQETVRTEKITTVETPAQPTPPTPPTEEPKE